MRQKFLLTLLVAMLVVSACGGTEAATPEISAEDIAATAVAEAWLLLTQTAAAMPTETPAPTLTFTPQPTETALVIPTLELLPTLPPAPADVVATPTSECNQIPLPEPKGQLVNVEFYNESEGSVNLAFGMNFPNDQGECFTYSFNPPNNKKVPLATQVLAGCYWGYAWITASEVSVARSGSVILCLTDPSVVYRIMITKERVDFK